MHQTLLRYGLALCLTAASLLQPISSARADDNKEYLIKAAFIYNFVKFVQWPDERAISNLPKIDICVVGDSPMSGTGAVFKQASSSQLALSLVSESSAKNAISHCHIVFLGKSANGEALAALKGQPVLTVSDVPGFAQRGGMVEFAMVDNKVKLIVNKKSADVAGLRIDPQMLQIALEVIR